MALTLMPKTTIGTLLKDYPFLLDFLAGYHPELKKLTNPVLRRTMARTATLEKAAAVSGVSLDRLMNDVASEIARANGERPEIAHAAGASIDPVRQEELKAIVAALHAGGTPEELKPRFAALIGDIEATEIAAMEEVLWPKDCLRLRSSGSATYTCRSSPTPSTSMSRSLPRRAIRSTRSSVRIGRFCRSPPPSAGSPNASAARRWRPNGSVSSRPWQRLSTVSLRSTVTSCARRTSSFPSSKSTALRVPRRSCGLSTTTSAASSRSCRTSLADDDPEAAVRAATEAATMADDMVTKEEKILFPMAVDTLSDDEWREIRAGESDIGYSLITDVPAWPAGGEASSPPGPIGATTFFSCVQAA